MGSESRNRYLLKNTLIFTLGNIGSRMISFFLIPLYTNVLTTSQYGTVDLITTISTVAGPMLTLNIAESVMRFGLDKDADKEKNTQCGSIVLLIAMIIGLVLIPIYSFIKNGGYVASCMLNKGEFVFELTNSTQRAEQFVGSKYVKSNPKTIYIDIERKLQEGKKVLFVGLPCQVAALKNFSRNQDNLYTVDLICHGSPSPELLKMYLKEKSVDIEELEGLNFREKTSFGLRSVGKNNGFPRIVDMYTYAFLKSIDYTENCYSCRYASQSRVSDISLGDSWGSELSEEEKKKGISLVLCQTKKGEELLKKSNVELFDADITRAIQLNHQLEYPSIIPSSRMFFFENLEKGFDFAMKKILPKEYLKNEIKIILSKVGIRR